MIISQAVAEYISGAHAAIDDPAIASCVEVHGDGTGPMAVKISAQAIRNHRVLRATYVEKVGAINLSEAPRSLGHAHALAALRDFGINAPENCVHGAHTCDRCKWVCGRPA